MVDSDTVREDGSLTVRVERDGDALLIHALGELDLSNTKTLEAELRRAIGTGASAVVLDLGGLAFIDSAGLRLLLLADRQSRRNGGRLTMRRGSFAVQRTVELSGLDKELPFKD